MNLNYFDKKKLSKSQRLMALIKAQVHNLSHHEIYSQLNSSARINCFMSYHIFAVWDFIKLLKSLHNKTNIALQEQNLACFSETENVIEEIVFAKESELYSYGQQTERFALYLCALAELESVINSTNF